VPEDGATRRLGAPGRAGNSSYEDLYWSLKLTVTFIWTFTGLPFSVAGS
jgi:hypothetical protein